jgi:hypothetical protein
MTNTNPIPAGALLVAIDVAKHRNAVLIEPPQGRRRHSLIVLNTREEHDRFIAALSAYGCCVVCALDVNKRRRFTPGGFSASA